MCLDPDGGFGGSGRSLFYLLLAARSPDISFEVWMRRSGPLAEAYKDAGIQVSIRSDMPTASSLPRFSRNLVGYSRGFWQLFRASQFRRDLASAGTQFDVVHFNHEGLAMLAWWFSRRRSCHTTMHIRKSITPTLFARFQMKMASKSIDHAIFITENEEALFRSLGGSAPGTVIYNVYRWKDQKAGLRPSVSEEDHRFKVAVLSNYAYSRGIDRIVEVASHLKQANRDGIVFVVAGDMRLRGKLPASLRKAARQGGTLEDYARQSGVADMFQFLGHVAEPAKVLAACDAVFKPTRQDNPWGRDIIEGLAAGKVVITNGTWNKFVEDGVTGILLPSFDGKVAASRIAALAEDSAMCARLGSAATARAENLFDPATNAARLVQIWNNIGSGITE